ncbi:fluoride efflux transporter FluC [Bhargavaea ullalensis]|uniref:Fluoride-specific ion channel FluC n=1 Tax=Bhargavaea ullalensis TaxID=1265685 RepID=A0ABV2GAM3_9BACL
MSAWTIGAVAAGGFLGAVARHVVSGRLNRPDRPFGTALVNLAGAFLAGFFLNGVLAGLPHAFAVYGFLGSFTTFSTWQSEVVGLWKKGSRRSAAISSSGLLVLGVLAAAFGWLAGHAGG